jgi:hypothetical protein
MNSRYFAIAAAVLLGAGQLALIAGKLLGHIHWTWLWVMAPLWLPVLAAVALIVIVVALFAGSASSGENPFR